MAAGTLRVQRAVRLGTAGSSNRPPLAAGWQRFHRLVHAEASQQVPIALTQGHGEGQRKQRCLVKADAAGAQLLQPEILKIDSAAQTKNTNQVFRFNPLARFLKKVFLPVDYPTSVTQNYLHFIQYTASQIFFSHMSRVLATQAMLLAVGVGGRETVPMAAVTAWVMKDGIGHLVAIVVSTLINQRFDSDPKRFRFQAAALGKFADSVSILTLQWPQYFLALSALGGAFSRLSISTGGSSRAKVYESFARLGNLGDIMRCSSAQATAAQLLGTGLGACLGQLLGSELTFLLCGSALLSLASMSCCYKATCFVQLTSMNRQRAELIFEPAVREICSLQRRGIDALGQPLLLPTVEEIRDAEVFVLPFRSRQAGRMEVNPTLTAAHVLLTPAAELRESKYCLGVRQLQHSLVTGQSFALWYHVEATPQEVLQGFLQAQLLRSLAAEAPSTQSLVELNTLAAQLSQDWWPTVNDALLFRGWRTDVVFLDAKDKRISVE